MAERESLNDRAVSMAAALMELETLLKDTNDYGDHTGFCVEMDGITNDAWDALGRLRSRASTLKRRLTLHRAATTQKEKTE